MKNTIKHAVVISFVIIYCQLYAQFPGTSSGPRDQDQTLIEPMDFSSYLNPYQSNNEGFEAWQRQRNLMLSQQTAQLQALENVIDAEDYLVGPGDTFMLNIWGAMEQHIPVTISPEGRLIIPTVGEIECINQTLKNIQHLVIEKATTFYSKCQISFTLVTPRLFMVHVTGEVKYPGTYQANAVTRVSDLLMLAGGVSRFAWKQCIPIRHADSSIDTANIVAFESYGDLKQNPFVSAGDVIIVVPMDPNSPFIIHVEGNVRHAGIFQVLPNENIKDFLIRIRAFSTELGLSSIYVVRQNNMDTGLKKDILFPFNRSIGEDFKLEPGDRIVLPLNYVFVKGSVNNPGPYAFAQNLKAKDYATMARWNGSINGVRVLHTLTGKKEKGPDVNIQPGDIVEVPQTWGQRFRVSFGIVTTLTSLILTAKAIGAL